MPRVLPVAHSKFGPQPRAWDREAGEMRGSVHLGRLGTGCLQCREGAKMVVFITGNCHYTCFYCPISEERRNKDVVYANERRLDSPDEIEALLEEARAIGASGTGITGGDPMRVPERVERYCRALKDAFGPSHHVHLYTQMTFSAEQAKRLKEAGLDEVRFHPQPQHWARVEATPYAEMVKRCRAAGLAVAFEVPGLPDHEDALLHLVTVAEGLGAQQVNLNELEFSTVNTPALLGHGYALRDDESNRVQDSNEACARVLLRARAAGVTIPLHYCASTFKDGVQLRRRLLRRAERTRAEFELATEDGTLVLGLIEAGSEAGEAYRLLLEEHQVPVELLRLVEGAKPRVETAPWILETIAPRLPWPSFLVEVYPTHDRLEVERTPLAPAGRTR